MFSLEFNKEKRFPEITEIRLPGSKSISNRLLILNAVAGSHQPIVGLSESRDSSLLNSALQKTGFDKWFEDGATPFRFYMAYAAAAGIPCTLDGTSGLRKRSMAAGIDLLRTYGVSVTCTEQEGFAPVAISGQLKQTHEMTIDVAKSSQFASALLLVSPLLAPVFTLHLLNPGLSHSYIDMSLECMKLFGTKIIERRPEKIRLDHSAFSAAGKSLRCEADWSAASYFYALCACIPTSVFVLKGLNITSVQGDSILMEWGKMLGVYSSETECGLQIQQSGQPVQNPVFDFSDHIDLAPAIIAVCGFLGIDATFIHIENLRYKESDRIRSLQVNLKKLGMELCESAGEWKIRQGIRPSEASQIAIETFDDHRIAMAFSIYALRYQIHIDNENCVIKSFPDFWNELGRCNFGIHHGA